MSGSVPGNSSVLSGMTSFHLNAFLALVIVVGLMVTVLFLAERLKKIMPRLLGKQAVSKGHISVDDVIHLDSKRKLVSISIKDQTGKKALAILMIGGSQDICVGWLNEPSSQDDIAHHPELKKDI